MSLALSVPYEQGPRNAVCVTAAAAARRVLASLCWCPLCVAVGAQESPGAMGEAGQKWEMLRSGPVSHRADLLELRRQTCVALSLLNISSEKCPLGGLPHPVGWLLDHVGSVSRK